MSTKDRNWFKNENSQDKKYNIRIEKCNRNKSKLTDSPSEIIESEEKKNNLEIKSEVTYRMLSSRSIYALRVPEGGEKKW